MLLDLTSQLLKASLRALICKLKLNHSRKSLLVKLSSPQLLLQLTRKTSRQRRLLAAPKLLTLKLSLKIRHQFESVKLQSQEKQSLRVLMPPKQMVNLFKTREQVVHLLRPSQRTVETSRRRFTLLNSQMEPKEVHHPFLKAPTSLTSMDCQLFTRSSNENSSLL